MVSKKGVIGIIEATIAIMIIFSVIYIAFSQTKKTSDEGVPDIMTPFLENIARNNSIRELALTNPAESEKILNSMFAEEAKKTNMGYAVRVCDYDKICGLEKYPEEASGSVYSNGRIISARNENEKHKTIQIFTWFKKA